VCECVSIYVLLTGAGCLRVYVCMCECRCVSEYIDFYACKCECMCASVRVCMSSLPGRGA